MSVEVHPTAIVGADVALGEGCVVGPYAVLEGEVQLGEGCVVGPFCRFVGPTRVGARNRFESHCSVGADPQDLKYRGERSLLEMGDDNVVREFVTLHRGTEGGGGVTRIGNRNLLMAYVHIAHDSKVGSRTIFANATTLAGHVEVGDDASLGAFSGIHQFCRVGPHAFLGGFTVATKDCLPFMSTVGSRPARCYGPNTIGLERKGFSEESRDALRRAWRHLHNPKLNASQAVAVIRQELAGQPEVDLLLAFIAGAATRGVILSRG